MSVNSLVPLVPPLGSGTAGQVKPERDNTGTQGGTTIIRALALNVFLRDTEWDTERDISRILVPRASNEVGQVEPAFEQRAPLPDPILDREAIHCERCNWSAQDWDHDRQERIAIAEYDGQAISSEAKRMARLDTVVRFMMAHLPEPAGDACMFCRELSGRKCVFVSRGQVAQAHDRCWTGFYHQAEAALCRMGVISLRPKVMR
jgi:hypothetical protein